MVAILHSLLDAILLPDEDERLLNLFDRLLEENLHNMDSDCPHSYHGHTPSIHAHFHTSTRLFYC